MERTSRFAPSRCQVLRGPVRPPEDGCGTCLAAGSHLPRRGRFPACSARLDGPSCHHRKAPISLVESPVRPVTHAPRIPQNAYDPQSPAHAPPTPPPGTADLRPPVRTPTEPVSGRRVTSTLDMEGIR